MREYTSTDYKDWEFAPESNWVGPYPKELKPVENHYGDTVLDPKSPDFGRAPVLQIGDKTKQPSFILLGDSYANALFPGFDIIGKQEGWSGLYLNLYMTPFWDRLNIEFPRDEALFTKIKAERLLECLKNNPCISHIIIHQQWHVRFLPAETWEGQPITSDNRWQKGFSSLAEFCRKIKAMGKDITFILPTPESSVSHATRIAPLLKRSELWYHSADFTPKVQSSRADYNQRNTPIREILKLLEKEGGCNLIDPIPYLFRKDIFDPIDGDNLIVFDHGHMTVYGSTKLISQLRHQINIILHPSETSQEKACRSGNMP